MLKIKDNVDLKELEKYGFENSMYLDAFYEYKQNNFTGLSIEASTRIVSIYNSVDNHVKGKTMSILYDLIKDGLVENVDE